MKHGFVDRHFICFPYETRRTGIYAAGPVRRPMDRKQAIEDAVGATMKAIQAAENAARGSGAHPRVGDLSYPSFRKEGCTQPEMADRPAGIRPTRIPEIVPMGDLNTAMIEKYRNNFSKEVEANVE